MDFKNFDFFNWSEMQTNKALASGFWHIWLRQLMICDVPQDVTQDGRFSSVINRLFSSGFLADPDKGQSSLPATNYTSIIKFFICPMVYFYQLY